MNKNKNEARYVDKEKSGAGHDQPNQHLALTDRAELSSSLSQVAEKRLTRFKSRRGRQILSRGDITNLTIRYACLTQDLPFDAESVQDELVSYRQATTIHDDFVGVAHDGIACDTPGLMMSGAAAVSAN